MTIKRFPHACGAMLAIKPSALDREYDTSELAANRAANNRITVHRAAAKPVAKKDASTMKKTLKNVLADLASVAEHGSPSERKIARKMISKLSELADQELDGKGARAPKSKLSAAEGAELDRRMGIQRKPRGTVELAGNRLIMR